MPDLAWIEGQILPMAEAKVAFLDHGYFYGYGVYEACKAWSGEIYALSEHMDRLERSLRALRIQPRQSRGELTAGLQELARQSGYDEVLLYLQITRGVGPRGVSLPNPVPVVTMFATQLQSVSPEDWERGAAVITVPDERWAHPDIKTLNLLPNILAKEKAETQGATEAIMYNAREIVTEAAASNVFAVLSDGRLVTPPTDGHILEGVSRLHILRRAKADGIAIEETYFTLTQLREAKEIFLSSTSPEIMPVTKLDGKAVGSGQPGSWTRRLYGSFLAEKGK